MILGVLVSWWQYVLFFCHQGTKFHNGYFSGAYLFKEVQWVIFTHYKLHMTKTKIQPPYLKPGDEVAIISPSFCIDEEVLTDAVTFLEKWGLKVRIGRNALKRSGPFAGNDRERLADLQEMTDDPAVKAVLCSRGGYGLSRIIDKVRFLRT